MSNLDIILESVIEDSANKKEGFTSVSIANKIKNSGYWIKTSEVSQFLRRWSLNNDDKYTVSQVEVKRTEDNQKVNAFLYHPIKTKLEDFNVECKALTPDDFLLINKPAPLPKLINIKKSTLVNVDGDGDVKQNKKSIIKEKDKDKEREKDKLDKKESNDEKETKIKSSFSKSNRNYSSFNFL